MKLIVDQLNFNVVLNDDDLSSSKIPVVFLHGFTGSTCDWIFLNGLLPINYYPIFIDLIGHGESDSPEDQAHYSCGAIVYHLNSIIEQLKLNQFILAGYSMGGRAALSYMIKYKQKIIAAILESATAGIENMHERKLRVEHDLLLADQIRKEGIDWFMEFWLNLPMFNSLKEIYNLDELKNKRTKNNVIGLSNSLAGFSAGLMSSLWEELLYIDFPVLYLTGGKDEKFTRLNQRMAENTKNSVHKIIDEAGHNTHLEKPELFTKFVVDFLIQLKGINEIQLD